MEYQNAVSEGHLETAHCTYSTEGLSQVRPVESLVPITVSSSLLYHTGSYSNREVWVSHPPALLWSHQASGQTEESTTLEPRMLVPTMSASSRFHMRERPARE